LFKTVAGVNTSLGTFNEALINGDERTIKLQIRDATKKVFIDGVERISSADNAITAAGRAGVRFSNALAGNMEMDNFDASDVAAAAAEAKILQAIYRGLEVAR
jgi:hypothetical protein